MLLLLAHTHRHRLCLHCDRVPPEHLLCHHPGLGHLLLVPVLPVGAALGTLQPQLEHTPVYGRHYAQEQEPVGHAERQQLHLACHRVLGVRPASWKAGGRMWGGCREDSPLPQLLPRNVVVTILAWVVGWGKEGADLEINPCLWSQTGLEPNPVLPFYWLFDL